MEKRPWPGTGAIFRGPSAGRDSQDSFHVLLVPGTRTQTARLARAHRLDLTRRHTRGSSPSSLTGSEQMYAASSSVTRPATIPSPSWTSSFEQAHLQSTLGSGVSSLNMPRSSPKSFLKQCSRPESVPSSQEAGAISETTFLLARTFSLLETVPTSGCSNA